MQVTINDAVFELSDAASTIELPELLQRYKAKPPYAVSLNGCFVPREAWSRTQVLEADCLDIVSPVFGG